MWVILMVVGGVLLMGGVTWLWLGDSGWGLIVAAIGWIVLGGAVFMHFVRRRLRRQ